MKHYLLVKRDGFDASGKGLTAKESALALLGAGIWPLWSFTRNRKAVRAGDKVAVYLTGTGNSVVIATAVIERVAAWDSVASRRYPLLLDGTPRAVLYLTTVNVFTEVVSVIPHLRRLSFVSGRLIKSRKWGVAFMGGMRSLTPADFRVLTG